jgi:hypothetical protein
MFSTLSIATLVLSVSLVSAECPNACSGHGDCLSQDQCICYDNFFGADCSMRVCPMDSAFVDVPRGDLNHDGKIGYGSVTSTYSNTQYARYQQYESWPTMIKRNPDADFTRSIKDGISVGAKNDNVLGGWAAQTGEAHFQMECSGKGTCDRNLGVCNCFDGYTGGACQRTTCPNDCSGHGLCRTVSDIALFAYNKHFERSEAGFNYYSGINTPYEYRLWDASHNAACACDPGYMGVDCALRECPKGDDPLTTSPATCGGTECQSEVQSFSVDGSQGGSGSLPLPGTYYLTFTDYTGISFTSTEFPLWTNPTEDPDWDEHQSANEAVVKARLESLPNNVTGTVVVTSTGGGNDAKDQYRVRVTFVGKSGNVPEMTLGWTKTSNTQTLRAYVFQPGQPVQSLWVDSSLGSINYIQLLVYPQDQTLYGLSTYWISKCQAVHVSNTKDGESEVADDIAAALNSIPAIRLSFGSPFIRDSNVVAQFSLTNAGAKTLTGGYHVRVAFPNKQFGLALIQAKTYSDSKCATLTTDSGKGIVQVTPFSDVTDGNQEYVTCANRGLCDFKSGLCKCFTGYTGVSCETQSTLAQ